FGPISPTMRPGATVKLTESTARFAPYCFLRSRASITGVIFVLSGRGGPGRARRGRGSCFEQVGRREPQPLDGRVDLGPFFFEEALPLVLHQRLARPGTHEHPEAAPLLDQLLIDELLVPLEHRERIQPELGSDTADRG